MEAVILTLLVSYSAADAVPANVLALAIMEQAAVSDVDAELITRIILVESAGRPHAINFKTRDYGLMQINANTARALHLSETCLLDWRCNLKAGVELLSTYDRSCRFNIGTGALKGRRLANCLTYEQKIASL